MAKTVPPVDDGPNSATPPDKFEALQFRTLEAEAKAKSAILRASTTNLPPIILAIRRAFPIT